MTPEAAALPQSPGWKVVHKRLQWVDRYHPDWVKRRDHSVHSRKNKRAAAILRG